MKALVFDMHIPRMAVTRLLGILTHRFQLDRYAEALLACRHQGKSRAVKVLFEYPE